MTSWMRRRVDSETARLPDSAYDTVLRDTPERRAISPMFIELPRGGPARPRTCRSTAATVEPIRLMQRSVAIAPAPGQSSRDVCIDHHRSRALWSIEPIARIDSIEDLMNNSTRPWRVATIGLALALAGAASACSSTAAPGSSAASGTSTVWDPYPQFDNGSAWVRLLDRCGTDSGVTVKRTAFDTTDLTGKVLLAAQQGNAPDVLIVDNPVVSTLAQA